MPISLIYKESAALRPSSGRNFGLAEGAVRHFRERCEALSLPRTEAFSDEGDAASIVVERGHCSDLIVLGQANPSEPGHRAAQGFVERVVLQASRPVLVVPFVGRFDTVGRRIVLAWDGGREAARAVADAMPMLCTANEVQLVHFAESDDDAHDARKAKSLRDVVQWLQWHGVQVQLRPQQRGDISVGEALLSLVADAGADLVVMGAYGHPRWSERVLGGATRTMLREMTVPVLMSH